MFKYKKWLIIWIHKSWNLLHFYDILYFKYIISQMYHLNMVFQFYLIELFDATFF